MFRSARTPLLPEEKRRGRKRETDLREVVNATFYLLEAGCQWRSLPHDFPHRSTVRTYFDQWKRKKVWHQLNKVLREKLRIEEERDRQPSAASIDSHSINYSHFTQQFKTRKFVFKNSLKLQIKNNSVNRDS